MLELFRTAIHSIIDAIEVKRGTFITLHERPNFAENGKQRARHNDENAEPRSAIVIQGPILHDRNFTMETIKLYKATAAASLIILSTWDDEDVRDIERIFGETVLILKNKKPKIAGLANINFQIISARAGIDAAKKAGAQYVLKTRTDQRIYSPAPMSFMYNLCDRFPLTVPGQQKQRIISVSLNTFKFRLYGVSDMFTYGHIDDILCYWSADTLQQSDSLLAGGNTNVATPEAYLCSEFLNKIGRSLSWNMKDSWQMLADHFCIVDEKMVDLFWYKYGRHREYRTPSYQGDIPKTEVSFSDWILMGSKEAVCDVISPKI